MISGRYQHRQLNRVDSDILDILTLTLTQANSTAKVSFAKIVELMNQRGPIRAQQRKARGKRTRREVKEEDDDSEVNGRADSVGTGDVIRVQMPATRRPRTEASVSNSSPSAGPAARNAARGRGRGYVERRVTRSTRGRGVARRQ